MAIYRVISFIFRIFQAGGEGGVDGSSRVEGGGGGEVLTNYE